MAMGEYARRFANKIIDAYRHDNKIFICGNGGSATQSQHFAGELVGRFLHKRKALPAISLAANIANITAIANDFGYEYVFVRQLEALANPHDLLIVLSTSGKSVNCLKAINWCRNKNVGVIDFPRIGKDTPEIQEYQFKLMHETCRLVEKYFIK